MLNATSPAMLAALLRGQALPAAEPPAEVPDAAEAPTAHILPQALAEWHRRAPEREGDALERATTPTAEFFDVLDKALATYTLAPQPVIEIDPAEDGG